MARAGGKRSVKASFASSATAPAPKSASGPNSSTVSVPEPFSPTSTKLRAFVSKLPQDHVYTVHIDENPVKLKKRVFVVPVLLNLFIASLLAWRVYYAAPAYLEQIITIFGFETAWSVKPKDMGVGDVMSTISGRTMLLMIDYALFGLIGSWPWEFLFGSKYSRFTSAVEWRRCLGFRDTEIVVRRGRKWDHPIVGLDDAERMKQGKGREWTQEEELVLKVKLDVAMRKGYTSKTGYLLLDKDWDLDFRAMIDAHKMLDRGDLQLRDIDHVVLVFYQDRWLMHYPHFEEPTKVTAKTEERDEKLQRFRNRLTDLGCDDVFFRWIEMLQFETSQPGGFTSDKKANAKEELERMITRKRADFATFWASVGGEDGVPGLGKDD